jgi:glycosyltransferase involved in cell wall biosynthesis
VEKISVLMPVRNGSRFLVEAISHVTNNILPEDEVVIVDDFSTDNTLTILKDWANLDSRVRIVQNSSAGLVNALNLGLQECSNNWIARFDVDDKYSLHRLSSQRALINSNTAAIFTDYCFITENGSTFGEMPSAVTDFGIKLSLLQGRRTAHPSVLFSKTKVLLSSGYRQDDFPAEDLALWLRLSQFGEFASVPEVHLFYTLSHGSITISKRKKSQAKRIEVVSKHISRNKNFEITSQDFSALVKVYKELPDGINRYFHFCLDIVLSRKFISVRSMTTLRIFWVFILCCFHLKGLNFARQIVTDYLLRKRLRKTLV